MKTQILHLDAHDDLISARDKMGWGQAGRILLVWPEQGSILQQKLDLELLARHAAHQGSQLALITRDRTILRHARETGIPVFKNLRQAQKSHWRLPRKQRRSKSLQRPESLPTRDEILQMAASRRESLAASNDLQTPARLAIFSVGLLAVLALVAVLLPSAQISIFPEVREQSVVLAVEAVPGLPKAQISGKLPAQPISIVVEGRSYLPASGMTMLPQEVATGKVTFTNLTDAPVTVPEGTVVRTLSSPLVRFATTHQMILPSGPGSSLDITVRSLQPGTQGNLPPGSLRAIEGSLGTQASVDNLDNTYGGVDRSMKAPSDADRKELYAQLMASLEKTALEEARLNLATGDFLLENSLSLEKVLEETWEPDPGLPAEQLGLSLRLTFTALVVTADDLEDLGNKLLDATLPGGFQAEPDSLQAEHLNQPQAEGTVWRVRFRRPIRAQIDAEEIPRRVRGLSPIKASARLSDLPLDSSPNFEITPSWWPQLPMLSFRIQVTIENRQGGVSP